MRIKDSLLRKGLVVVQFTFSIALIIGVLVVSKQLHYIQQQDNGYSRSQVMSFTISWKLVSNDEKRAGLMEAMKQALLTKSSISTVAMLNQNSILGMTGLQSGSADWEGRDPDFHPSMAHFSVDDDFAKIVSLDVVKGRWFERGTQNDIRNVLLNETAVKELGIRQPVIGQPFRFNGDTGVIVGVVKDFHFRSMHDKIGPMIIKKANKYLHTLLIKADAGQVKAAANAAGQVWKEFFPAEPLALNFLDEEFDKLYKTDQKASLLISLFAAVAIIISCLGLFGLAAFTAERRTKEIGIRKVLGAGVAGIVQLLSREFVLLVAVAFLLASPLAWYGMNAWLQEFAYRVNISWWIFAAGGLASIAIAIATVCFHAIKAAVANPVKSLRTE